MELLDPDVGGRGRCDDIADECLVFEYTGQPVLRPQRRRQSGPAGIDENEFDFMADHRFDAGLLERRVDPTQRSAAAHRDRCPVLFEEGGGAPGQTVADDAQCRQVDADALITDHADVIGEGDAGLVDGKGVPRGAGA